VPVPTLAIPAVPSYTCKVKIPALADRFEFGSLSGYAVILQVPPVDDGCIRLPRCRKLVSRENRALSPLRKFEPGN
jgi:hypothetical protein